VAPAGLRTPLGGRSIVTVAVLIALLGAIGFAQSRPGEHLVRSLGIAAPSEPYTELFFLAPLQIAQQTESAHSGMNFERVSFVIVDKTHRAIDYRWTAGAANGVQTSGIVPLGPGQRDTVTTAVAIACPRRLAAAPAARHARRSAKRRASGRRVARPRPQRATPHQVPVLVRLAPGSEQISYLFGCNA
jgi:hypothetical protein